MNPSKILGGGLAALCVGLVVAAGARAEPPKVSPKSAAGPAAAVAAADAYLAALRKKDDPAATKVAERDTPDPWVVADELLARGEREAAKRLAQTKPRLRTEGLVAWVDGSPPKDPDAPLRKALVAAEAFIERGDPEAAKKSLGASAQVKGDVARVRLVVARVRVEGRQPGAAAGLLGLLEDAEHGAERIGWKGGVAWVLQMRGVLFLVSKDVAKALPVLGAAVERWREIGAISSAATCLEGIANAHSAGGDTGKALELLEDALRWVSEAGDREAEASLELTIGNNHVAREEFARALEHFRRAEQLAEGGADRALLARAVGNQGRALAVLGRPDEALPLRERERAIWVETGDRVRAVGALGDIGNLHHQRGDDERAREVLERALAECKALGDETGVARNIGNLGLVYDALGEPERALALHEESVKRRDDAGDALGVARAQANVGLQRRRLGDEPGALDAYRRAREAFRALGARRELVDVLVALAPVAAGLGAVEEGEGALAEAEKLTDAGGYVEGRASVMNARGLTLQRVSRDAEALDAYADALRLAEARGDVYVSSQALQNMATIHYGLGDYGQAKASQERALALAERAHDVRSRDIVLGNLANTYLRLGEVDRAIGLLERLRTSSAASKDRAGLARATGNLAVALSDKKDEARALELHRESMSLFRALRNGHDAAIAEQSIAWILLRRGEVAEAEAHFQAVLREAEELRADTLVVSTLAGLGRVREAQGDARGALAFARRGVEVHERLVRGLADEEGSIARGHTRNPFGIGASAAFHLGDAASLVFFLESGRAGTLREALRSRGGAEAAGLPKDLLDAEEAAREAEAKAVGELRRAVTRGEVKRVKALQRAADEARERVRVAVEAIRRKANLASAVGYAGVDALDTFRSRLGADEALVLYGVFDLASVAVVIEAGAARMVDLGDSKPLREAVATALAADARGVPLLEPAALERLGKLLVEPLKLRADLRRVLVSPDGAVSFVPFGLLLGDREVALVPSGTTHGLLLAERDRRGSGVLALGDPEYGPASAASEGAVTRGGSSFRLRPLSATRAEVNRVGTVKLLGPDATEARLRAAAAATPYWRAIHLACHGLIDPERPMLSSLALTPTALDDGFLTCVEVTRMRLPAELVVLSACQTAIGKAHHGEGVLGLARAFMCAGSPRILCSLWPVDDAATATLMTEFYGAWNPPAGTAARSPSAALRVAQQRLRDDPRTAHPRYWAGWTLWGLPQ